MVHLPPQGFHHQTDQCIRDDIRNKSRIETNGVMRADNRNGELHVAFAIPSAELTNWESWLQTKGIAVEEKRKWELGAWSLYFRDPVTTVAVKV